MITFRLTEYDCTGYDVHIGSADSYAKLPWSRCDALKSYTVWRGSEAVVEFAGCMVCVVKAWLADNPDFDATEGYIAIGEDFHCSDWNA